MTVIVAVYAKPLHPFLDGMMVKVTVIGAFVRLVKVPEMFPVPVAGIPVTLTVLSLVHENVEPRTSAESVIAATGLPEQVL